MRLMTSLLVSFWMAPALPLWAAQQQAVPRPPAAVVADQSQQPPILVGPPPPPATQLEALEPEPGSLLTVGYDDLGDVAGIFVEVRETSDSGGRHARGVVVSIGERRSPREVAYIDEEELPPLIKAFDSVLNVNSNPTPFRSFEQRYTTHGELALVASSRNRIVTFRVEVGRMVRVTSAALNGSELHQLRTFFEAASQKLATLPDGKDLAQDPSKDLATEVRRQGGVPGLDVVQR
jgi:hypothetical protein